MKRFSSAPTRATVIKNLKANSLKALLLGTALALSTLVPVAHANSFEEQINALRQQNNEVLAAQEDLETQEADLAAAIAAIQGRITDLQKQINSNQAKHGELQRSIAEAEAEIAKQREILGVNIKQMYLEGDMSTVEKLASSRDFSEYVDKEQYRLSVQAKIKDGLERIEELKKQQESQKAEIEKLLADQQAMQGELSAQRAESSRLLSLNQSQQAHYEAEVSQNNARIAELRRLQAIENMRHFSGGVSYAGADGYPWAGVPFPNTMSDPWGMYKRQCVSYTAWKVASTGRHMPYWGGRGNAKLWPNNARQAGIPVDTNPRVGDVAISTKGTYGHAMYVEAVHRDGTITVSQYNAGWDGKYSVGRRSAAGLQFIHF